MNTKLILGLSLVIGMASLTSCETKVDGCTDSAADNYNSNATDDDGSCHYSKKIGDSYGGGIVVHVDLDGQHGIIAATEDQSDSIEWHNNGVDVQTYTTATTIYSGDNNTAQIIAVQGPGTYAATICDNLVLNGYDDWFLPSKSELKQIYDNRSYLDGIEEDFYWSSTENDNEFYINLAWYHHMGNGHVATNFKSYKARVRAVRIF